MLTLNELERRAYMAGLSDLAGAYARLADAEDAFDAAARLLSTLDDCPPLTDDVADAAQALERLLP